MEVPHRGGRPRIGQLLIQAGVLSGAELAAGLGEQARLRRRRIGDLLVESRLVCRERLEEAAGKTAASRQGGDSPRLGERLASAGLIGRDRLKEALSALHNDRNEKLGTLLIRKGLITEEQLLASLAGKFSLRRIDLDETVPTPAALGLIARQVAIRMKVVPVEVRGRHLVIATADPTDPMLQEYLGFTAGCPVELVVATSRQIRDAQRKFYAEQEQRGEPLPKDAGADAGAVAAEPEGEAVDEADSSVIRLVNEILLTSVKKRASDIHFEPGQGEEPLEVRFRVDGECHRIRQIPACYKKAVISRLKILSSLDIAERRRPQSGKLFLRSGGKRLEYRVEITPTAGGQEDAVLRVMANVRPIPLAGIGFSPPNLERFKALLDKPHGIILCVGPTGSGKTTTLHSALGHLNAPNRKIWTAEDPVEITQPGLRQVQVNRKIGLSFSEALRSFLRADPDIIMVGEMRDPETARIAVEASLTGHLVFSTLHTNSAAETVNRLLQVGIDPLHFADALLGILAQRLVLKLCGHCRQPYRPEPAEHDRLIRAYGPELAAIDRLPAAVGEVVLMRKTGCERCGGTGYHGRVAIHELLVGSAALQQMIIDRQSVAEMRRLAIEEGMRPLRQDGIRKVFEGVTDFEQVLRVCA